MTKTIINQQILRQKRRIFSFVDWGGTNTDARIEKNIKPFEEKTGIKVTVVTPSDYAKLIAMVENGTTEWDVMNCDAYWGVYAGKKGYLEPIDYKTVTEKLDKAVELEHVVGAEVYDSVISYNSDKYTADSAPNHGLTFMIYRSSQVKELSGSTL